jgi:hypothetical protein
MKTNLRTSPTKKERGNTIVENAAYILEDARLNGKRGDYKNYTQYRFRLCLLNLPAKEYEQNIKKLCEVLGI